MAVAALDAILHTDDIANFLESEARRLNRSCFGVSEPTRFKVGLLEAFAQELRKTGEAIFTSRHLGRLICAACALERNGDPSGHFLSLTIGDCIEFVDPQRSHAEFNVKACGFNPDRFRRRFFASSPASFAIA